MITSGEMGDIFYQLFLLAMQVGGPILIVAMAIGIVISILQAATQIHEQTLTFVPKLAIIGVMLIVMGNSMLIRIQDFARYIFTLIAGG